MFKHRRALHLVGRIFCEFPVLYRLEEPLLVNQRYCFQDKVAQRGVFAYGVTQYCGGHCQNSFRPRAQLRYLLLA